MTDFPHEPPRPTSDEVLVELTNHVQALAGPTARPRQEQIDAVTAVTAGRQRTLLVARTGFGKSAVYFSATRMLRDRGWGPTIVVSPLLALMRDQVAAAEKLGVRAVSINSSNVDAWSALEAQLEADEVDLLLIAPERLANPGFRRRVFDALQTRAFALVCDEAHCISDWGHDFRPDYRRLRRLLADLPPWTPVLATTATANQRVTDDVAAQLGDDTLVLRTSLDRSSLNLSVVDLPDDARRLAWLSETLPLIEGSGIIYCLTVAQAQTAADFLTAQGHQVAAYSGAVAPDDRLALEDALKNNSIKALIATSALGMGYDKGDLAFCIHLGLPPSPVAYYQQIGRAGRSIERAEIIALPRPIEDAAVWKWFESVSLPSEDVCLALLEQLDPNISVSSVSLETSVNLGRSRLGTLLNILEVDGAVTRDGRNWLRTDEPWSYNHELATTLKTLRQAESAQMLDWASLTTCRLRYLREALDDHEASDCARCDRCTNHTWQRDPSPAVIALAEDQLRGGDIQLDPRRQWPTGLASPRGRIAKTHQAMEGRALARVGDGGWNPVIEQLLTGNAAASAHDELVDAIAQILKRWDWDQRPTWICPVPSRRNADLINSVATSLGTLGKLPVSHGLVAGATQHDETFQVDQANSAHQVAGVWDRFLVDEAALPDKSVRDGPVLLIDDEIVSRWTMTVAAYRLLDAGTGPVLPFALRAR